MSLIKEFKEFSIKGNAIDMAVGLIIGAAFSKIVTSLVDDMIMPPIGLLIGGVDFSDLVFTLKAATETQNAVTLNYGLFLNTMINFLIISGTIFFVIKGMNALRKKNSSKPTTTKCPECQMDIPLKASRCGFCTARL